MQELIACFAIGQAFAILKATCCRKIRLPSFIANNIMPVFEILNMKHGIEFLGSVL